MASNVNRVDRPLKQDLIGLRLQSRAKRLRDGSAGGCDDCRDPCDG
jgi:hypothetical protein